MCCLVVETCVVSYGNRQNVRSCCCQNVHLNHSALSLADLLSIHMSVSMLSSACMLDRRETFQFVSVVQDIEQTRPTDHVVVVRWAGMSRVHAVGCHLSYHREDSGLHPLGHSNRQSSQCSGD